MGKICGVLRPAETMLVWVALAAGALPASAADCTLSATSLAFPGAYDPIGAHAAADLDGSSAISFTCSRTLPGVERVNFSLSLSTGGSGTYTPRRMAAGANTLDYNLFTDATRSVIWGNGTGGTSLVTGKFNLTPGQPTRSESLTVYGRIPRAQDAAAGNYLDSVTVTLSF
jgi:spore coat protein U-like protein